MELIQIVDETGNFTGEIIDKELAHDKNLLHNEISVFIINDSKQVLLQKRSPNKRFAPNKYGSCAGHVDAYESLEDAALRELKEEVGLKISKNDLYPFLEKQIFKKDTNSHITYLYYTKCNKEVEDFIIQEEELSEVKWFDIDKVIDMIKANDDAITFKKNRLYIFEELKKLYEERNNMKLYDELLWRGLIENITDEELIEKINNGGLTFYIGTDPTGDSLHIGHYSTFSMATRLKQGGHNPILLVGGATGLIGDPKPTAERPMITKELLDYNYKKLRKQVEDLFGFEVVNNFDWSKDINFIDYLRDYGKYFNLNYMLNKETVKSRLDTGITYTEFSYMIMQALDFLYLYENKNCILQIGGSDQWGNITSGVELIRKKIGGNAYGLTMPLITKADGTKFGKSEGNAIWLDKEKTSSYEMYQFFLNAEDVKVIEYLKKLTFLSREEIEELEQKHNENPHLREAHKALAREVITFLHSKEDYEKAVKISESLFGGNVKELDVNDIMVGFKDVPHFTLTKEVGIVDMLVNNGICSSKREAREFINSGSITISDEKVMDENMLVNSGTAIEGKLLVVRRGKKKYYLGIFE